MSSGNMRAASDDVVIECVREHLPLRRGSMARPVQNGHGKGRAVALRASGAYMEDSRSWCDAL